MLTPVDPETHPELRPGRTRPTPGCRDVPERDRGMGLRPGDGHRPVRRPRDPAIRLRRLLAQLRYVGHASAARLPETGQFGPFRRRSTRRASCSTRKPSSRRPGTRYRRHGTSSSRSPIESWRTGGRRGASPSRMAFASGWPGTDFLESLVLRVGGVEIYDAWTRGEIGFTSPAVMEAGRLADALVFSARLREGRCGEHQRRALREPTPTHARSRQCDRRDRTGVLDVPPGPVPADNRLPQPIRSARMSISSCSLRSIQVSRLRPSVRRPSCRPLPTDQRCGSSWTSSPAPSGARSGPQGAMLLLPQPTLRPLELWRREPRSWC